MVRVAHPPRVVASTAGTRRSSPTCASRGTEFLRAQEAPRVFGILSSTAQDIRRYRVDGVRLWERRESGWFVHTYRHVAAQLVRVITRSDGRDVPIYGSPHYERAATKQASKKEIRVAQTLLRRDPLTPSGISK